MSNPTNSFSATSSSALETQFAKSDGATTPPIDYYITPPSSPPPPTTEQPDNELIQKFKKANHQSLTNQNHEEEKDTIESLYQAITTLKKFQVDADTIDKKSDDNYTESDRKFAAFICTNIKLYKKIDSSATPSTQKTQINLVWGRIAKVFADTGLKLTPNNILSIYSYLVRLQKQLKRHDYFTKRTQATPHQSISKTNKHPTITDNQKMPPPKPVPKHKKTKETKQPHFFPTNIQNKTEVPHIQHLETLAQNSSVLSNNNPKPPLNATNSQDNQPTKLIYPEHKENNRNQLCSNKKHETTLQQRHTTSSNQTDFTSPNTEMNSMTKSALSILATSATPPIINTDAKKEIKSTMQNRFFTTIYSTPFFAPQQKNQLKNVTATTIASENDPVAPLHAKVVPWNKT